MQTSKVINTITRNSNKSTNPKVKIVKTEDKIPNSGYALSSKKLLSKGFKFLYGLETSIQEMISNL